MPAAAASDVPPEGDELATVRRTAGRLLVGFVLVTAAIVFWPSSDVASASVWWMSSVLQGLGAPLWVTPSLMEFCSNIVMFVPLTFLGLLWRPELGWRNWARLGLWSTLVIEVGQALLLPGRSPTLLDVVANGVGGLAGALLAVPALAGLRLARWSSPMLR